MLVSELLSFVMWGSSGSLDQRADFSNDVIFFFFFLAKGLMNN